MTRSALAIGIVALTVVGQPVAAQRVVHRAQRIAGTATIAIRNQIGSVTIVGWEHDSLVLRGTVARNADVLFGGGARAAKVGVWEWHDPNPTTPSHFTVWVPRDSEIEVKTVSAHITVRNVGGTFNSADGHITVSGPVDRIEAESIGGDIDVRADVPWVRARSGGGLSLRGTMEDVTAATVGGRLTAAVHGVLRGAFTTISGDITYHGDVTTGGLYEFDAHSGTITLDLSPDTGGMRFDLASVTGIIDNGRSDHRPTIGAGQRGHALQWVVGDGGARIVARTLRGAILLR